MSAWDAVAEAVVAERPDGHAPPGAVFALSEGDETHVAAAGAADLRTGERMTPSHAFDLASVSKTLTTLALRRLIDDGSLTDHTTAGAVLGARAGAAVDATVDDLMRHRAGLTEWWPLYLVADAREDPVAAGLRLPRRYPLRAARHYSDIGMQALGAVIARATGAPLTEAVRRLVLDPLGATTVAPAAAAPGSPAAAGPDGDAIEREMVRSGVPYPVGLATDGFGWRTRTLRGEVADGNAYHAFGGAAGHAGWFGDAAGLMAIAGVLADPLAHGLGDDSVRALSTELDDGQGQGVMIYRLPWRGRPRTFVGHSGFTGTFVAAAAATDADPAVRAVLLTNRLHGRPAPVRQRLVASETLWREAMARADDLLHPSTTGARP
ncbi:serine hydrolase domain-containing protein [Microbacterium marinilacus]|uniref:Serine hydrolase domain-containing protein n=1 Tax=Microbacterium marinilacus TaxID=415209 RepID=A0ABP7B8I5_9MICO|nr:serine hydrolase domain-containing protein [Microbacterium marinilacus]MBY0687240.1 beta-lactamase family protein [Microbacterium marinilacus]